MLSYQSKTTYPTRSGNDANAAKPSSRESAMPVPQAVPTSFRMDNELS